MNDTHNGEELAAQASSLRWLARAFWNVPDQAWLDAFDGEELRAAGVSTDIAGRLADAISSAGEGFLRDAAVDYTSLFASSDLAAPHPYESIYFGRARQMMQGCRDDVLLCYQAAGFDSASAEPSEANEPEDHLSYELCFLAYLLDFAVYAENVEERDLYLDEAGRFAEEHLGVWLASFVFEVSEQAGTELYRAVAATLEELVRSMEGSLGRS